MSNNDPESEKHARTTESRDDETKTRKSWLRIQQPYDTLLKKFKIDPCETQSDKSDTWSKDSDTCSTLTDFGTDESSRNKRKLKLCGLHCHELETKMVKKQISKAKKVMRNTKKKSLLVKSSFTKQQKHSAINLKKIWHPNQRLAYNYLRLRGVHVKCLENESKEEKRNSLVSLKENHHLVSNVFNFDKPLVRDALGLRCKQDKNILNPITWEETENDQIGANRRKCETPLFDMTISDRLYVRPAVKCRKKEVIRNPITGEEVSFTRV